jgi:hypothetical protein
MSTSSSSSMASLSATPVKPLEEEEGTWDEVAGVGFASGAFLADDIREIAG